MGGGAGRRASARDPGPAPHPQSPKGPQDLRTPGPQDPGAQGCSEHARATEMLGSLGAQRSSGSQDLRNGGWTGESRPSSDGLPRHLPDKVSSTSSSSGPAPGGRGVGSHPRLPLFSWIIAPTSPPGRGPRRYPRPAPPHPAGAASSRLRGACPLVPATLLRATEGSGGSRRGEARPSPWEPPWPLSPSSKLRLVGRMHARR